MREYKIRREKCLYRSERSELRFGKMRVVFPVAWLVPCGDTHAQDEHSSCREVRVRGKEQQIHHARYGRPAPASFGVTSIDGISVLSPCFSKQGLFVRSSLKMTSTAAYSVPSSAVLSPPRARRASWFTVVRSRFFFVVALVRPALVDSLLRLRRHLGDDAVDAVDDAVGRFDVGRDDLVTGDGERRRRWSCRS